ncbi:hypothetical protein EPN29_06995 [bacterium]|nr:MAG: hypothetical protein EPN29_06995 [bacterium]
MNKRPGQIKVTIDAGHCSFCARTRNLRREERHLGTLVRTVVTCESCHRTLSSSMGLAGADTPAVAEPAPTTEDATPAAAAVEDPPEPKPAKRAAAPRAAAAAKPKAPKSRAPKTK